MSAFPTHLEAMDADWLAGALGEPPGALKGFSATRVGTGQMADSFRLALDWADPDRGPASVIAKCPSRDAASRAIAAQLGSYASEVNFYRHLATRAGLPLPRCFHAELADDGVAFLLLLEDLSPARAGDQLAGASLDEIEAAVDALAALHASFWNATDLDTRPWLQRDSKALVRALFPTLHAGFRDRYATRLAAPVHALGRALDEKLEAYLAYAPVARTIVHGDFRVDNLMFRPGDPPIVWALDWQTHGIGAGANDLAYLIGTSILDARERNAAMRPMFDRWVAGLAARGVCPDRDALWRDARVGALSGYVMAVFASMSVQRTERGDEMFAVMAERPAALAIALDSLGAL